MRAEMTIGIDLKKLEGLRIFNGYETSKYDREVSYLAFDTHFVVKNP